MTVAQRAALDSSKPRRRLVLYSLSILAIFVLITQNEIKLDVSTTTRSAADRVTTRSHHHRRPLHKDETTSSTSVAEIGQDRQDIHLPSQQQQQQTQSPNITNNATLSFRQDVTLCEKPNEPPLGRCDLTKGSCGIPLLWIGNPHARSARSWDTLTNLASSVKFHSNNNNNNDTNDEYNYNQPQGFVEAFGAKSISEMRGLNEHGNEPGHCWILRVMCQLQSDNIQRDDDNDDNNNDDTAVFSLKAKPKSAIFGTLWNPYLGAMKHKKTKPALAWLAKYPHIKVVYKKRNFLDMAMDEYGELFPESAGTIPLQEIKNLFWNYERQDTLLQELLEPVNYLTVEYEKLYFTTESGEWQRLWNFVMQMTNIPQSMTDIHKHAASWPRLPPLRNESIANYDEVSRYIQNKAKYAQYLEPIPRVELPPVDWDAIDCVGTTKRYHTCNLTDTTWGIPVILIGFGRSGTTVTWDTLASMTSYPHEGQGGVEATGSGQTSALDQLQKYPHEHGKCWMERILCNLQFRNRRRFGQGHGLSAVYGTKWKASLRVFSHRKSREVVEWLAAHPHIKVIHNTRNLLDIAVSRYKHGLHNGKLSSHCQDEYCAANVTASHLVMPVDAVLESLTTLEHGRAYVKRQLDAFQVSRVDVTYEKLYYAPTAKEWIRLLQFVGAGPTQRNLTMVDVKQHLHFVVTHAPQRNETLENYKDIADALKGTTFEKYLRSVWEEALLS